VIETTRLAKSVTSVHSDYWFTDKLSITRIMEFQYHLGFAFWSVPRTMELQQFEGTVAVDVRPRVVSVHVSGNVHEHFSLDYENANEDISMPDCEPDPLDSELTGRGRSNSQDLVMSGYEDDGTNYELDAQVPVSDAGADDHDIDDLIQAFDEMHIYEAGRA
jgi:hypothetical protein